MSKYSFFIFFLWNPTGKPVSPLGFADSLRERRSLVLRNPDYRRIHPRLKPWLSAVGVNNASLPGLACMTFFKNVSGY
jgi:hypothetical protein